MHHSTGGQCREEQVDVGEKKQKEGGEDRLGGGTEWTPTEGRTIKTCRYESATNEWNEHLYNMEDTQSRESNRKG